MFFSCDIGYMITRERKYARGDAASAGRSSFLTESSTGTTGNIVQYWGSALMWRQEIRNLLMVFSGQSLHSQAPPLFYINTGQTTAYLSRLLCNSQNIRQSCHLRWLVKRGIQLVAKNHRVNTFWVWMFDVFLQNRHCEEHESHPLIRTRSERALIVSSLVFVNVTQAV